MKLRLAFVLLALSLAFSVLASCGGHTTAGYPGDDAGPYVGSDAGGNPIQDASGPALDAGEPPGVSHHGFTWSNTGPQTNDLYGVWGQSPDDVLVRRRGGDDPALRRTGVRVVRHPGPDRLPERVGLGGRQRVGRGLSHLDRGGFGDLALER